MASQKQQDHQEELLRAVEQHAAPGVAELLDLYDVAESYYVEAAAATSEAHTEVIAAATSR